MRKTNPDLTCWGSIYGNSRQVNTLREKTPISSKPKSFPKERSLIKLTYLKVLYATHDIINAYITLKDFKK
jgi:hypothetical protein